MWFVREWLFGNVKIFEKNLDKIEENIHEEYYKRIKNIKNKKEKYNIKLNIISELYYKQGFKDGVEFALKNIK